MLNTEKHQAWNLRKQKKVKETSFEMDISTSSKKYWQTKLAPGNVFCSEKVISVKQRSNYPPTDKFIEQVHEHTHAPSQMEVEVTKVKSKIKKKKATTTLETPQ